MKSYSRIVIVAAVAMLAASSYATLIGSLHLNDGQDITTGVENFSGLNTRTSNGNSDTRGTVQGKVNFIAGAPIDTDGDPNTGSNYAGAKFPIYSGVTQFNDLNRYKSASSGGGLITWDYDFSGVVSEGAFKLLLDFTNRVNVNDSQFYISYNDGSTLTLDTTDVSTNAIFGADVVLGQAGKYTQIATVTGVEGTMSIDLTSIITTAQANGGTVRLAYVDNNFLGDVRFQNESGIVTTIPEPATLGMVGIFGGAVMFIRRRFMI